MATVAKQTSGNTSSDRAFLKDKLEAALPSGFRCTTRYIHSLPKPTESLFSALPGHSPEKTRLASHFLTVSFSPALLLPPALPLSSDTGSDVIGFAIEVLVFTTQYLTTIFVSKVDSTPYIPRVRPSPIKAVVSTFLQWLADEELQKRPKRKVVISLFARAQAQYLFPGSADDRTKHVLDDRQLIRWWARVLNPILVKTESSPSDVKYQGYLTVPGYTGNELKSFVPPAVSGSPNWLFGNPLLELARTRGIPEQAPPRCLLPRFPDDPKARFMQDLDDEVGLSQDAQVHVSPSKKKSGRWKSVTDMERFWEQMEFRQECSSGRVVGFLWLVMSPNGCEFEKPLADSFKFGNTDSQDSTDSFRKPPSSVQVLQSQSKILATVSPKKGRRKQLTGPILARQPRLKGGSSSLSSLSEMAAQAKNGSVVSKEGYDTAIHTLLNLDFSMLGPAIRSSSKWVAEITSIAGLTDDFGVAITGTAAVETPANVSSSNDVGTINDIGGMIRRKRKLRQESDVTVMTEEAVRDDSRSVNVLGGGTIRKKPKPDAK